MKEVTISYTLEEAQVLMNLLDAAVRAQGLQAAQSALFFAGKLQTAIQEATSTVAETTAE